MQEGPDSSVGGHIHRAAMRLPPFWPDRPGLWFAKAEAQFVLGTVKGQNSTT